MHALTSHPNLLPRSRLLHARLLAPLGLADSMYLGLPHAEAHRCVTHSVSAMLREAGLELTDAFSSAGARGGTHGEGGGDGGGAVASLEGLGQMQQLLNPATLNMATLRAACLPGASMHASAHGLASFYAALASAQPVL